LQSKLGGGEGVEGLYGSIKGSDMQRILQCMVAYCGMCTTSILVDMGAGLGRPLLHALLSVGLPAAWGIEVDPVKCQKAAAFMDQVQRTLQRRDGGSFPDIQLPRFDCAAIGRVGGLDPLTHAYSFWEGIPVDARADFGRLFRESRTMVGLTVVQRSMRSADPAAAMDEWYGFGALELCSSFPVGMSGSGQRFQAYVFKRVPAPPTLQIVPGCLEEAAAAAAARLPQRLKRPAITAEDAAVLASAAQRKRARCSSPAAADATFFAGTCASATAVAAAAALYAAAPPRGGSSAAAAAEQPAARVRQRSQRIAGAGVGASARVTGGANATGSGEVGSTVVFRWPLRPTQHQGAEVGVPAGALAQRSAMPSGVWMPSRRAGRSVEAAPMEKVQLPRRGLGVPSRQFG
jgi:hypothetical protein